MRKWLVLAAYVSASYSNALMFGIYSDNLQQFASYYGSSVTAIQNLQYVGLITQIILCLPAIRLIQWRLDYSIIASTYLSTCASWLCYFSVKNIVITYASLILNSIAQLLILPTCFYLPEVWFPLEERSIAIGIGFYANLLGYVTGGIITSLVVVNESQVHIQILIIAIINSLAFIATFILVKNQPDKQIQKLTRVQLTHIKTLWRHKFMAYNAVALSVFLGVSWSFQGQCKSSSYLVSQMEVLFDAPKVAGLMIVWVFSGGIFGITMSWVVQKWLQKTGEYKFYDKICKFCLVTGYAGFLILGTLVYLKTTIYIIFILLMICIGIGSIGFFGLTFLALIQSLYPVPVLLIGTLIVASASIYSIMSITINQIFYNVNEYFSISIVVTLPLIYILYSYETNFKRYKYYLNQKETKFELLKIIQEDEQENQKQE